VIRPTGELAAFERRFARKQADAASHARSLEIFTALWMEALALGAWPRRDWEADLEPDLAVARVLDERAAP
jgi:hypothetical protein